MDPIILWLISAAIVVYLIMIIMIPIWIKEIKQLNQKQLNVLISIRNMLYSTVNENDDSSKQNKAA